MKKITYEEAVQRFIDQGRTDIELIKENYVSFNKKAKFLDKTVNKYFWATPYRVFTCKTNHSDLLYVKSSKKLSLSFEEASKRFSHRTDIKLDEIEYKNWGTKAKFWDEVEQDYFWSRPCDVLKLGSCHPKRAVRKRAETSTISFSVARQRFIDQDRDDIELIESGYNGWKKKSLFLDKNLNEYWYAVPNKVFHRKSNHPKTKADKIAAKVKLSFEEAAQRFIDQGRDDIELNKECYIDWTTKAKFWDNVKGDWFWNIPVSVYNRKMCHPNRKVVSKGQKSLFEELEKTFFNQDILLEKRILIGKNNDYYFPDILFPVHKIIIEYNGDYWHANPKIYNENYYNKRNKKYAKEIWKQDKIRNNNLENNGYKVFVVWENDFNNNNKEKILNDLKEKIFSLIC